jgi:hypothetical protein
MSQIDIFQYSPVPDMTKNPHEMTFWQSSDQCIQNWTVSWMMMHAN